MWFIANFCLLHFLTHLPVVSTLPVNSCPEGRDYEVDTYIESSPSSTHWGEWAWDLKPALRVPSGAVVHATCYTAVNWWQRHEERGFAVPEAMKEIHAAGCERENVGDRFPCGKLGPHLMTGPIYVEGAEPGDVLQVDILDVDVITDWGWNMVRPGAGSLKTFAGGFLTIALDLERRVVKPPWGGEVPWNVTGTGPFFGQLGVAPPPERGRVSSVEPSPDFGGNIDNKHLGRGATLYLPVNVPGALFSAGDGHAVQGDGEVCVTALETSLAGVFRLTTRKDLGANSNSSWVPAGRSRPAQLRAETQSHYITMAFAPDLDAAEVDSLEDMLNWMETVTGLAREDLYRLTSLAADMHVTQVVNVNKGVHLLLPKSVLPTNAKPTNRLANAR
mmetsp:Transcript_40675/g.77655  ORF Transcript_40675/g.77655 Transcript_40675/m.77655 type:complete len:389 (+) Transcript_40675:156-1322(+)